jgi:uncharacterized protein YhfF/RimJ/RimL family protein N-acetyltransferase
MEARQHKSTFGWEGDEELGELLIREILCGIKTATAGPKDLYSPQELANLHAQKGERITVLDKHGNARTTIQMLDVFETTFGSPDERLIAGEGFTSVEDFQNSHIKAYADLISAGKLSLDPDTVLVGELFTLDPNVTLQPFEPHEYPELIHLLLSNSWPFHGPQSLSSEMIHERVTNGFYVGPDTKSFWVIVDRDRHGFIRLFDLGEEESDENPLFDVRLAEAVRGLGVGRAAVAQLVQHVFINYPAKIRIEATTRHDNRAMRRVLEHCGFVKEGHFRDAWPTAEGRTDCVSYAVLRRDWESGATIKVDFRN